jgi:hypothetical protein
VGVRGGRREKKREKKERKRGGGGGAIKFYWVVVRVQLVDCKYLNNLLQEGKIYIAKFI